MFKVLLSNKVIAFLFFATCFYLPSNAFEYKIGQIEEFNSNAEILAGQGSSIEKNRYSLSFVQSRLQLKYGENLSISKNIPFSNSYTIFDAQLQDNVVLGMADDKIFVVILQNNMPNYILLNKSELGVDEDETITAPSLVNRNGNTLKINFVVIKHVNKRRFSFELSLIKNKKKRKKSNRTNSNNDVKRTKTKKVFRKKSETTTSRRKPKKKETINNETQSENNIIKLKKKCDGYNRTIQIPEEAMLSSCPLCKGNQIVYDSCTNRNKSKRLFYYYCCFCEGKVRKSIKQRAPVTLRLEKACYLEHYKEHRKVEMPACPYEECKRAGNNFNVFAKGWTKDKQEYKFVCFVCRRFFKQKIITGSPIPILRFSSKHSDSIRKKLPFYYQVQEGVTEVYSGNKLCISDKDNIVSEENIQDFNPDTGTVLQLVDGKVVFLMIKNNKPYRIELDKSDLKLDKNCTIHFVRIHSEDDEEIVLEFITDQKKESILRPVEIEC